MFLLCASTQKLNEDRDIIATRSMRRPRFKDANVFFLERLQRGESSFKIPGTVTHGDVTYVKRRAIAAGILACHGNAEKVITPLQVVESFIFFWQ